MTPLDIGVLSRAPTSYSTRRLVEAGKQRGHDIRVFDTLRFGIDLSGKRPGLNYRGRPLRELDAVIPRIGASITFYGMAVVRQFEQMDVYTPNTSHSIANSRDKLRANQILSRHELPIPATTFAKDRRDVMSAIAGVGGAPVVIKLLEGTQGIGVILAPDDKMAEAVIETLQSTRQNVLIQRFVPESRGCDIRAFVIGDQVVAAMRRVALPGEFRSNIHRGGTAEPVELDEAYRDVAVRSAQIMGLRVAGVDMLESDSGPRVLEVNSSPGLEGIETYTGLDIAGAIIDYVAAEASFPDIDIRQRLSVSTNYGVAEILVNDGAALLEADTTIGDLRAMDITVLTLHRGHTVIPNPRDSHELQADDRLLCFGNMSILRDLVPEPAARRRRTAAKPLPIDALPIAPSNDHTAVVPDKD